jgi:hypothetical protein
MWRSTFDDVDRMNANFRLLSPLMSSMLAGPSSLSRIEVHAPETDFSQIQENMGAGTIWSERSEYYANDNDFQTGFVSKQRQIIPTEKASGEESSACTSQPHFTVKNWNEARPIMQEFVDNAAGQEGCTYFGWTRNGEKLRWQSKFADGSALLEHARLVKPLMERLGAGPAVLERLEVHGPHDEVAKAKEEFLALGHGKTEIYEAHDAKRLEGAAASSEVKAPEASSQSQTA